MKHVREVVGDEMRHVRDVVGEEMRHVRDVVGEEMKHVKEVVRGYFIGRLEEAPAYMRFNEFIQCETPSWYYLLEFYY